MSVLRRRHPADFVGSGCKQLIAACEAPGDKFDESSISVGCSLGRGIESQPLLMSERCGCGWDNQLNPRFSLELDFREREQGLRAEGCFEPLAADNDTQTKLVEEQPNLGDGHRA